MCQRVSRGGRQGVSRGGKGCQDPCQCVKGCQKLSRRVKTLANPPSLDPSEATRPYERARGQTGGTAQVRATCGAGSSSPLTPYVLLTVTRRHRTRRGAWEVVGVRI
jgi:hypothetical protein